MRNFLIWIVIGGCVCLAGGFILRTYANPGLRANVVAGIAGAVGEGHLLAPLLSLSQLSPMVVSLSAMLMAILRAMSLMPAMHLLRQSRQRGRSR